MILYGGLVIGCDYAQLTVQFLTRCLCNRAHLKPVLLNKLSRPIWLLFTDGEDGRGRQSVINRASKTVGCF